MEKLRTSVVGLGNLGIVYARILKELPESELVAVSTRNRQTLDKVSSELGVEGYEDEGEMLKKSGSQVVFIATPQGVHLQNTVTAMKAGNHVYCTKPMAVTLKEADRMIEISKKTRKKLEIGFHYRFSPHILKIRELIQSGEIGRVVSALSMMQQYRGPEYWAQGRWRGTTSGAGGGVLMTNYSHDLDFVQWFLGKVSWVSGYADTLIQPVEVEDYASATMKFKRGAVYSLNMSTASWASNAPRLEVFGSKGAISLMDKKDSSWKSLGTSLFVHTDGKWNELAFEQDKGITERFADRLLPWTVPATGLASVHTFFAQFSDFLQAIMNGRKNSVDGAEGRKSLEIALAIYLSSKRGRRVEIPLR